MANVLVYFGVENVPVTGLTNPQKQTLVTKLQALGVNNASSKPNERNHFRTRLDNNALIFEGLFNEGNLDAPAIRQFLAETFEVDVSLITNSAPQNTAYGKLSTFSYNSQQKIRIIAFGHDGTSWGTIAQSRTAVQAYLADNAVAWGES